MTDTLKTTRLVGEPLSEKHYPDLCRLHSDTAVMHTLSANGLPLSDEVTAQRLSIAERHWQQHGYGLWAFYHCDSGEFIGRGGLISYCLEDLDNRREVGLAYAVMSEFWQQGYATEIALASVRYGFLELNLSQIASWTLPTNFGSQRVMEKLGFNYERDFLFAELPHQFYVLTRKAFLSTSA